MSKIIKFPVSLVCPLCHEDSLDIVQNPEDTESSIHCHSCDQTFEILNGFPDLIVGERFENESDSDCLCYEEESNKYSTLNYWIPLFKKMQTNFDNPLKILAIGCGIGLEVDLLCEAGFQCVGIDNGNRANVWPKRIHNENLVMANGMHLPFNKDEFDVVFCGCVFPHVGVVGDSIEVTEHYLEDRTKLAAEMTRVLSPEGQIVVASPNRKFPMDIFHGRDQGQLKAHINKPDEKFLLSMTDYKKIFFDGGCVNYDTLPVEGFWGFVRSKHSLKGLIVSLPVRFVFKLVSFKVFSFLRGSFILPWIAMSFRKS